MRFRATAQLRKGRKTGNESEDEASAVEMVLDKGCRTALSAAGKGVPSIALSECLLMRYVYKKKYSKLKNTEQ
jgi:hypothetical protein